MSINLNAEALGIGIPYREVIGQEPVTRLQLCWRIRPVSEGADMSINLNTHKLRCLIALDDGVAKQLSPRAGDAYFRAFILEDRVTGEMSMVYRFRYTGPEERSWYRVTTPETSEEAFAHFKVGIAAVLKIAFSTAGFDFDLVIECHEPPDDGGDVGRTMIWMEMQDLVEIQEPDEESTPKPELI